MKRASEIRLALLFTLFGLCILPVSGAATAQQAAARRAGPWNLAELKQVPPAEWGATEGLLQQVYYQGEPRDGKPTRIFAYFARPAEGQGPFPAMVLVHGGGGTAFPEWATLWAQRGYCAIAMDLGGCGPNRQPLADGMPGQGDEAKFRDFAQAEACDMWSYHAVAAVIRAHSLLASRPEVDPRRIGITGISWGGYLTCLVSGLDDRLAVSVPVYGCGFLHENSAWLPRFAAMSAEQRDRWVENFDPARYLPGVGCPILFMNGTNDFAYPLDSYQKSYGAVPGRVDLCIRARMPHGHAEGWNPVEIGLFVDSFLAQGKPLPKVSAMSVEDGKRVSAKVESAVPLVRGELLYTSDTGSWQKREWKTMEASLADGAVCADLPSERPLVFFLNVIDDRGAVVSTRHQELP